MMYRRVITLAVGALLVLALAVPAVATQTKIPVSGTDTISQMVDEGRTWMADGIQHVRGWTGEYATVGEPGAYLDGTSIVVANWNLDTASGDGTMWGTIELTLTGGGGGWHESWVAKFDGGVWSGWAVGRGFGTLDGMKMDLDVWSTGEGTDSFLGFIR
jgi:hypothetical protein